MKLIFSKDGFATKICGQYDFIYFGKPAPLWPGMVEAMQDYFSIPEKHRCQNEAAEMEWGGESISFNCFVPGGSSSQMLDDTSDTIFRVSYSFKSLEWAIKIIAKNSDHTEYFIKSVAESFLSNV